MAEVSATETIVSTESNTASPDAGANVSTAETQSAAPQEGRTEKPVDEKPKQERTYTREETERWLQRRLAREQRRLEREYTLRLENEILKRGVSPQAQGGGDEEPKPENFKDWDSYNRALVRWEIRQAQHEESKHRSQQEREQDFVRKAEEVKSTLWSKGADKYEDFVEVVSGEGVTFTDSMIDALLDTDVPADVAYYLGEHPEESRRIGKLSTAKQVREIDAIASKFTKPPEPTKAPEPIKPNSGNSAATPKTLEGTANNYEEWLKVRYRQLGRQLP